MTTTLPYIVLPASIPKILEKAGQAQTPERFTQDFLSTKLGFKGGNYRQFIPLAKKLGLVGSDGTPTDLYRQFRNPTNSRAALAAAIKNGYRDLFERNEYAGSLNKDQLKGLVVEVTGLEAKDRVTQLICQTFEELRKLADFDSAIRREADRKADDDDGGKDDDDAGGGGRDFGLNLAYTINLVLPKTDDPAVFNAIFRALRENLLQKRK